VKSVTPGVALLRFCRVDSVLPRPWNGGPRRAHELGWSSSRPAGAPWWPRATYRACGSVEAALGDLGKLAAARITSSTTARPAGFSTTTTATVPTRRTSLRSSPTTPTWPPATWQCF